MCSINNVNKILILINTYVLLLFILFAIPSQVMNIYITFVFSFYKLNTKMWFLLMVSATVRAEINFACRIPILAEFIYLSIFNYTIFYNKFVINI